MGRSTFSASSGAARGRWLAVAAALVVALLTPRMLAANSVTISGGVALISVPDGGALDSNPAPLIIETHFAIVDPEGFWEAEGDVIADATGPETAVLTVTELLIEKVAGDFDWDMFTVTHDFVPIVTYIPAYSADMDGAYDQTQLPIIVYAHLILDPQINSVSMGAMDGGIAQNKPKQVPFIGASGPFFSATPPEQQKAVFGFYLDTVGDSIRLFDSVHIQGYVAPVPGLGPVALAVLALALVVASTFWFARGLRAG